MAESSDSEGESVGDDGFSTGSGDGEEGSGPGEEAADDSPTLVSIVTADFAMQNLILQMGLQLVSPDGRQIRRISRWVLRCSACFKVTKVGAFSHMPAIWPWALEMCRLFLYFQDRARVLVAGHWLALNLSVQMLLCLGRRWSGCSVRPAAMPPCKRWRWP